ncbi:hypothetical protein IEQ34_014903 [Dendrobium chrysotoxum]|uniref:Uncharacterized protein n=1 Tax=Dendrobium chrysotoxum TaxID=161865 RepID=A0AAV7GLG7_DENCH|nr:hypothetical protein IEQ34_014903 [Dendrobium chrysotoxum]
MGEENSWRSSIEGVVRFRQMVRRWRKAAPEDVPAGHVAVCVGRCSKRFVVRVVHLNHPIFRELLERAEMEYGFSAHAGPLSLPCDEYFFEDALRCISDSSSTQPTKTKLSSSSCLTNRQDQRNLGLRCCRVAYGEDDDLSRFRRIAEKS